MARFVLVGVLGDFVTTFLSFNSFRMMRLPEIEPRASIEGEASL